MHKRRDDLESKPFFCLLFEMQCIISKSTEKSIATLWYLYILIIITVSTVHLAMDRTFFSSLESAQ